MFTVKFRVWSFHRHGLYIAHCVLMTESSFSRAFAFQLGFTSSEGALLSHLIEGALLPKINYILRERRDVTYSWNPVWAHARRFHPPEALGHRVESSPLHSRSSWNNYYLLGGKKIIPTTGSTVWELYFFFSRWHTTKMCMCMIMCVYVCMYVCMWVCLCACMCLCVCVYMHVYVYVCVREGYYVFLWAEQKGAYYKKRLFRLLHVKATVGTSASKQVYTKALVYFFQAS